MIIYNAEEKTKEAHVYAKGFISIVVVKINLFKTELLNMSILIRKRKKENL